MGSGIEPEPTDADAPDGGGSERTLAHELRSWRVDRVLGPLVLAAATVGAVAAGLTRDALTAAWSWLLFAPTIVALLRAGALTVKLWRRKAWRRSELDRLGTTRATNVWTAATTGVVRAADRGLAARLLLNDGLVIQSQGWVLLGLGAVQTGAVGSTAEVLSFRVLLGAVFLVASAAVFYLLHRRAATAARFLDPDDSEPPPAPR